MINVTYNTTSRKIILLAKTKTDKTELEKMTTSMTNQGRFFEKEVTTTAIIVRVPLLSESLVIELADFAQ